MRVIARELAARIFDEDTRVKLHTQRHLVRQHGMIGALRWNAMCANAWLHERFGRRHYVELDAVDASRARKSDTVFVFGSGASLNALAPDEWAHFARHDVFGFNAFYHQQWIPVDFHLLRVGIYGSMNWRPYAEEIQRVLATNPLFASTIYLLQNEYLGHFANQLVGYGYLPHGSRMLRFHAARGDGSPHRDLRRGIRHTGGTLSDAVNLAYTLGWGHIVLVGVDLYDSRYFYLPGDKTTTLDQREGRVVASEYSLRGVRYDESHQTVRLGIVNLMSSWRDQFQREGVHLSVYNERSLLADVLPVYPKPRLAVSGHR